MVPLPMRWAHTRDKVQREVVLSNLQATTAVVTCVHHVSNSFSSMFVCSSVCIEGEKEK